MSAITMIIYGILANLIPKKLVGMCLVRYARTEPNKTVIQLFDELTS